MVLLVFSETNPHSLQKALKVEVVMEGIFRAFLSQNLMSEPVFQGCHSQGKIVNSSLSAL